MDIEHILNDCLNKAMCQKGRIQKPNSNNIADFVNNYLEAINYTRCCDKLKDLKDDNFDGYTLVDIKGGQIVIHKGEIYTMEFINEFNKMK